MMTLLPMTSAAEPSRICQARLLMTTSGAFAFGETESWPARERERPAS